MSPSPIRVLVVDDHQIVRKGTIALLTEIDDLEIVGEASNGVEAVEQVNHLQPDVVLMDLIMPQMDGIEAIGHITAQHHETAVIALTSFATDDKVFPAIKAGALGYYLKDSNPEDLIQAIRQVHRGEPSLHPTIAQKVLHEVSRPRTQEKPDVDPLTTREIEVLRLVAQGWSNLQIAEQLIIAEVTVRTHVSNILGKLHLANRVQATLYALNEGIASLETTPDEDDV